MDDIELDDIFLGVEVGLIVGILCLLTFATGWVLAVQAIVEANDPLVLMDLSIVGPPGWTRQLVLIGVAALLATVVTDVYRSISNGEIDLSELPVEE